ncbi:MAG: hypothetical protein JW841_17950 [Deltaproteobacteria bacterium]|nr:hypothetical protein [Deltaproteobacteria bacterium]
MCPSKHKDSTEHLIQTGEALRSKNAEKSNRRKRPPSTRQIVQEAERLIGRVPQNAGTKSMLRLIVVLSVIALVTAGLFFILI